MGLFVKGQGAVALKKTQFPLAEDCYINLRELSSVELNDYQTQADTDIKNLDFIYDLVSKCALDDTGNPLFSNAEDVKLNFNIGVSKFVEIQEAILSLSGLNAKKN